ncbi:DUF1217 domain-containing protein [Pseudogemmobacter faecipullorum]|uniref:DUF1217 domain-containing protein n=1 Tax=Pseudogemmobacter faecipullorum TaxID=2755041 RepID=A0ABS8CPT3_9RHOB|nr:DUF1217 domain-containing protein [Pseudogemmobacter faecipullorum]MCB5410840.1 DUF1217 domain-containing protein [Pseudogemmobacter faecipullorum]
MIATSGLSGAFALKLIHRSRDSFEAAIQRDPVNSREITAFRERVGQITTAEQLVNDFEVYSFVMKAYDLESHIFGKAMMKKVLSSTSGEKGALIDKMTDSRFKDLYHALGFTEGGTANKNTSDPEWVETMVGRYVEQKLINSQLEMNSTAGTVLHAEARAPKLSNWYTVLADPKLQDFFYTALNLSDALKSSDIDMQASMLKKKFDITTLNEPGVLDGLISRYTAIADARTAQQSLSSNPILQLFSPNRSSSGQRAIIGISLDGLATLRQRRY